MKARCITGKFS